ncbi:MAG: hypothetical protein EZS28_025870 [Streblomastix strix]|uniref:Uncharacterized protein n=1 Tax=Streblomastix strix TaxID=222440 RepID=A0A5J4V7X6_9EUKA|nr:MAG: hypothetical protein EZS28_025870 [Streblomastix strix]
MQFRCDIVTAGLSLILVIIIFLYVPYYSFASIYLSAIPCRRWLLTDDEYPLIDISRFSRNLAQILLTQRIERQMKNWIKAESIYKLARQSHPSLPLRFVLYCISKDNNSQSGGPDKKNNNGMSTLILNTEMVQEEEFYEGIKQEMKDFFKNMTSLYTNFEMKYPYLRQIVESELKLRSCYEKLMVLQPTNETVPRNYEDLLKYIMMMILLELSYNTQKCLKKLIQRVRTTQSVIISHKQQIHLF